MQREEVEEIRGLLVRFGDEVDLNLDFELAPASFGDFEGGGFDSCRGLGSAFIGGTWRQCVVGMVVVAVVVAVVVVVVMVVIRTADGIGVRLVKLKLHLLDEVVDIAATRSLHHDRPFVRVIWRKGRRAIIGFVRCSNAAVDYPEAIIQHLSSRQ